MIRPRAPLPPVHFRPRAAAVCLIVSLPVAFGSLAMLPSNPGYVGVAIGTGVIVGACLIWSIIKSGSTVAWLGVGALIAGRKIAEELFPFVHDSPLFADNLLFISIAIALPIGLSLACWTLRES